MQGSQGPLSTQRLADRAAERLGRDGINRRSFLVRTAVIGSALAVTPTRFLFEPGTAYANITGVCGSGDESDCPYGFSVFCATINNGLNKCPTGTLPGGWWRAAGSSWCCGGDRFYLDCAYPCSTGCSCPECTPGTNCINFAGNCDKRLSCYSNTAYHQCNTQYACLNPVRCRVVSCVNPSAIPSFNCAANDLSDPRTSEHSAPGLVMPSWENAELVAPDQFDLSPAVAQSRSDLGRTDVIVRGHGWLSVLEQPVDRLRWLERLAIHRSPYPGHQWQPVGGGDHLR